MSEILKTVWGKLYAWALPSALAIGATWFFLLPHREHLGLNTGQAEDNEGLAVFLVLTGALAISLSALSTQLYRILEGYSFWPHWLQEWGIKRQCARKKALHAAVAGNGWRQGIALEKLARYPLDDDQIAPTRFGNAIRAFETYGKTRFNMDSQTLWHELVAVAPKYIQSEINSAQSSVDFFVALFYISFVFGLICSVLAIAQFKIGILLLSIPAFSLTIVCHWLAIKAIDAWSYSVHALVNLGRVKLADGLGLRLPASLEDEKTMWGLVTKYAYYANRTYGKALDAFRKTPAEVSQGSDEKQCDERSEQESADY